MGVVRTYSDFERRYFPETVAKRERDSETPEEAGRRIAHDALADHERRAIDDD